MEYSSGRCYADNWWKLRRGMWQVAPLRNNGTSNWVCCCLLLVASGTPIIDKRVQCCAAQCMFCVFEGRRAIRPPRGQCGLLSTTPALLQPIHSQQQHYYREALLRHQKQLLCKYGNTLLILNPNTPVCGDN
jgi:hypothetical protein